MTNQDTQNYEVIYEEAGKMEMMKMMAIKEKRIDETFPASVWCSLLRAIAFEKKKLCFTKFAGFLKLEWCVHFWLYSYQGCIMI